MSIKGRCSRFPFLFYVLGHEPISQFGDCQGAAFGRFLACWIVALRHLSSNALGPRPCILRSDPSDTRDCVAPRRCATARASPINNNIRFGPCRPHADAKSGHLSIPYCVFPLASFKFVDNAFGDPLACHVAAPRFSPLGPRGNTGEARNRKLRETQGSKIYAKRPISSALGTYRKSGET